MRGRYAVAYRYDTQCHATCSCSRTRHGNGLRAHTQATGARNGQRFAWLRPQQGLICAISDCSKHMQHLNMNGSNYTIAEGCHVDGNKPSAFKATQSSLSYKSRKACKHMNVFVRSSQVKRSQGLNMNGSKICMRRWLLCRWKASLPQLHRCRVFYIQAKKIAYTDILLCEQRKHK